MRCSGSLYGLVVFSVAHLSRASDSDFLTLRKKCNKYFYTYKQTLRDYIVSDGHLSRTFLTKRKEMLTKVEYVICFGGTQLSVTESTMQIRAFCSWLFSMLQYGPMSSLLILLHDSSPRTFIHSYINLNTLQDTQERSQPSHG